jgi:hypothetical protein
VVTYGGRCWYTEIKMAGFSSGGLFSSLLGRDCSEIETDPRADLFDKEICHSIRHFEETFKDFTLPSFSPPSFDKEDRRIHDDDPQSLRDSILSRSIPSRERPFNPRRRRSFSEDENLDDAVGGDLNVVEDILNGEEREGKRMNPFIQKNYSTKVEMSTVQKSDGVRMKSVI